MMIEFNDGEWIHAGKPDLSQITTLSWQSLDHGGNLKIKNTSLTGVQTTSTVFNTIM